MTSPVSIQDDSALSPTSQRAFSVRARAGIGLSKLARSPSNGSLNSVLSLVNDSSSEQHFRVCTHCINLLDAREMQKAKQFDKPIVCEFYEKMREYMSEASQHLAMYNKMWESLKYVNFYYIFKTISVYPCPCNIYRIKNCNTRYNFFSVQVINYKTSIGRTYSNVHKIISEKARLHTV